MSHDDTSNDLYIAWSPIYHPAWDDTPEAYVEHGLVEWSRSRRLARCDDPLLRFKAYLGVQHYDPVRWNVTGEPRTVYFVSLFLSGRTLSLRTYPTLTEALSAVRAFHTTLAASTQT